jgi:hypothetical protein
VKLQRPPPEIRIFLPARSARSRTATRGAFACFDRAHQASRPGAQYFRIEFVDHDREEALTANSAANDYCILLI